MELTWVSGVDPVSPPKFSLKSKTFETSVVNSTIRGTMLEEYNYSLDLG